MKKLSFLLFAGVAGLFVTSCSSEEISDSDMSLNSTATAPLAADIQVQDLVGTWNMDSMTSDVPVDFDQNGITTSDLLEETSCFSSMYFKFSDTGAVNTTQSRLYFDGGSGKFTCQTTKDYAATYSIVGNELTVNFTVDGANFSETKTISLFTENGIRFLKVTLTKAETNSAVYVAKDPGNTVASDIQEINMIYRKQ